MSKLSTQTNLGKGRSLMGSYVDLMNRVYLSLVFAQLMIFMLRAFIHKPSLELLQILGSINW